MAARTFSQRPGARQPYGAVTVRATRTSKHKLELLRTAARHVDTRADRPRTWGECKRRGMPARCPYVGCKHHLYLDVNPKTGSIKLNFPSLEVEQLAYKCSLEVAERGAVRLEDAGQLMNLTRERARQIEARAVAKAVPLAIEMGLCDE